MENTHPSTNICLACIGDPVLKEALRSTAVDSVCDFCGQSNPGVTIADLARHVDGTLRSVLSQGETSARFSVDSDSPSYEQDGDELLLYAQELLDIDLEPAEALVEALIEQDPANPGDGEDPFFADDQLYQRADVVDWEFEETWREFAELLKHDQRFFGSDARAQLARILGESGSVEAAELPVFTLGEEGSPVQIFRARRAKSFEDARILLSAPHRELSAPHPRLVTGGRMNPAGIAVFYGAMSEEVAIAEVRPSVGGIVIVGHFAPEGPIRLLDLTQLHQVSASGSVFADNYYERQARAKFLRGFHRLIVQPVQPEDEPLEYLPTQAVAEYVRNVLGFDGILYASTQIGALETDWLDDDVPDVVREHCNVALFARLVREHSSDRWSFPALIGTRVEHPLKYEDGSAHAVRIGRVAYDSVSVDVPDAHANPDF